MRGPGGLPLTARTLRLPATGRAARPTGRAARPAPQTHCTGPAPALRLLPTSCRTAALRAPASRSALMQACRTRYRAAWPAAAPPARTRQRVRSRPDQPPRPRSPLRSVAALLRRGLVGVPSPEPLLRGVRSCAPRCPGPLPTARLGPLRGGFHWGGPQAPAFMPWLAPGHLPRVPQPEKGRYSLTRPAAPSVHRGLATPKPRPKGIQAVQVGPIKHQLNCTFTLQAK